MNRYNLSLVLLLILIVSCKKATNQITVVPGLPPAPSGQKWEFIPEFSDEFNINNLDTVKWIPTHHYWSGRQPSRFLSSNVTLKNGLLELRSTPMVSDLGTVADPEKDVWVNASCVSSKKLVYYGYYEARIKASMLSMTSSFWFQGKFSEIDVIENLGAPAKYPENAFKMLMNTHYFPDGWTSDRATPLEWKMPEGAADDFHIYGLWWKDKNNVWLYHNGEKVAELKTGGEFWESMYMFFDTEVFIWQGLPTIGSLKDSTKNAMQVDWIRSWKLVPVKS